MNTILLGAGLLTLTIFTLYFFGIIVQAISIGIEKGIKRITPELDYNFSLVMFISIVTLCIIIAVLTVLWFFGNMAKSILN